MFIFLETKFFKPQKKKKKNIIYFYFFRNKIIFSKTKNQKQTDQSKNLINGKILFTESNAKSQIYIFPQLCSEEGGPIMAISGFADNSVKLIKDFNGVDFNTYTENSPH